MTLLDNAMKRATETVCSLLSDKWLIVGWSQDTRYKYCALRHTNGNRALVQVDNNTVSIFINRQLRKQIPVS